MEEIWKEIEGSDGLFSVSNLGRIKQNHYEYISLQNKKITREEKIIEPGIWQSRYLRVDIQNCRKYKRFRKAVYVHKLVAEYFLGPRPEGYEIDHIDGNYLNNRADNLRYVTKKQNANNPISKQKLINSLHELWNDPIKSKECSKKISEGTKIGMQKSGAAQKVSKANTDRHPMFKGDQQKRPKTKDVEKYLKEGWQFGYPQKTIDKLIAARNSR